jgi:hypothetical protein
MQKEKTKRWVTEGRNDGRRSEMYIVLFVKKSYLGEVVVHKSKWTEKNGKTEK